MTTAVDAEPPSPRRVLLAWLDVPEEEGNGVTTPPPSTGVAPHCLLWPQKRVVTEDDRASEWVLAANALLRGAPVRQVLRQEQFADMMSALEKELSKEPRLVTVHCDEKSPWEAVTVVGDLHGQRSDLLGAVCGPFMKGTRPVSHLLFLGDYVDRGPDGADVIALLALLKLCFPAHVTLLRGNHEEPSVTQVYGYARELSTKYPIGQQKVDATEHELWERSHTAFAHLPVAAEVHGGGKRVFFCHGGIAPPMLACPASSVVADLPALVDACPLAAPEHADDHEHKSESQQTFDGLLWSDPGDDPCGDVLQPNPRGCGWGWSQAATDRFLELNGYDWMCRAHQCVKGGYQWTHKDKVLTVFTAANYCGTAGNLGAVLHLSPARSGEGLDVQLVTHSAEDVSGLCTTSSGRMPPYFQPPSGAACDAAPLVLPYQGTAQEILTEIRACASQYEEHKGSSSPALEVSEAVSAALILCGGDGGSSMWRYTDDAGTDEAADYCFDFRVDGKWVIALTSEQKVAVEGSKFVVCVPQDQVRRVDTDEYDKPAELVIVEGGNSYRGSLQDDTFKGTWSVSEDGSSGEFVMKRLR
eukprot:TRINITY_DN50146_c0_g1_i1.p1 TRINITY_DN50146_c0_g1~~TRINITY_DN50146_c0_g1_i1.p1  ORF type:complete len:585 (+),score=164.10 TRINITY_DN50146_c0_g1_i1:182-1936(+)